jgi:hypothetical protein
VITVVKFRNSGKVASCIRETGLVCDVEKVEIEQWGAVRNVNTVIDNTFRRWDVNSWASTAGLKRLASEHIAFVIADKVFGDGAIDVVFEPCGVCGVEDSRPVVEDVIHVVLAEAAFPLFGTLIIIVVMIVVVFMFIVVWICCTESNQ